MTGALSLRVPFAVFGPSFFIGLAVLGWLAWQAGRTARPCLVLLVVWSFMMYGATLGQNRFGYYLNLALALLAGFAVGRALAWGWSLPLARRSSADARRWRGGADGRPNCWAVVRRAVAVAAVVLVVFVPSALIAWPMAGNDSGLGDDYRASLAWLRGNTPEPFPDPDYYYARYRARRPTAVARRSFSSRDASRRTRPPSPTWTAPVTAAGRSSAWTPGKPRSRSSR